ncbi:MAG: hypothetical protein M1392_03580 [Gammaproteobacteria bacterium]|nr:hypothetical protein [Gammaproteobacteria bacterium]
MAWRFDNPLRTLTDDASNKVAMEIWEAESLGGITENNNRLPQPVVYLLVLTIVSAFLITFPLWGQRPTAAIYEEFVAMMDSPEVQGLATDEEKMSYMVQKAKETGSKYATPHINHPITMDDLRVLRPQIEALKGQDVVLDDYTVVGDKIVLANFEGNLRADGTQVRQQPWWDQGYTIDIFYVIYFCLAVMIVVKRLPPYTVQPRHGNERILSDAEMAELSGQRRVA